VDSEYCMNSECSLTLIFRAVLKVGKVININLFCLFSFT
jgi:hypothetical protein